MKTKFSSYCLNTLPEGCRYCVKGEKLVLFISGKCSRNCWYCSLSQKRKNTDQIWANEREISSPRELIKEANESRATSAGITGGDPLIFLSRTLKFASALKKHFGKKFHIHIYLPTLLVTRENLAKLRKVIDEVRFHPSFLITNSQKDYQKDKEKIILASSFWNNEHIGCELPILPDKKQEILNFILDIKDKVGFVNLNEFEISETNFKQVTKNYNLSKDTYTIQDSRKAGIWILNQLNKKKIKIGVHLCTAQLKNNFQFRNRLHLHSVLPFGKRTEDGNVIYLVTDITNLKAVNQDKINKFHLDRQKNRIILSEMTARKFINSNIKIRRVEEFPTYDQIEIESEDLN